MPSNKVDVDPKFDAFAERLQAWHGDAEAAYAGGGRATWLRPDPANPASPADYAGLLAPFDHSRATSQGREAMSGEGGTVADLVAANAMIAYLSTAARAYLDWQTDGPLRAFAHAAAQQHDLAALDGPVAAAARDFVNRTLAAGAAGG